MGFFFIFLSCQDFIIPHARAVSNQDNARATLPSSDGWSGGILADTPCPGYFFLYHEVGSEHFCFLFSVTSFIYRYVFYPLGIVPGEFICKIV